MAKHKISISFSSNYEDVYNFLKSKSNISNYVCEVIQEKMTDTGDDLDLERKIEEIINRVISEKGISLSNNILVSTSNSVENLSSDELDLIKNIF